MLECSPSGDWPQFHRPCAAVNALLALEGGRAVLAQRDRLPRAHRDAGLLVARNAKARIAEDDMIGESGHRLHLAADQQRVLLRDQQAAVEGNLRPAACGEQGVVE